MAIPRYQTRRNKRRRSLDSEVVATAGLLGFDLMPWQRDLLGPAMEWRADGRPFHKTVVVTVPRQQGKTVLVAAVAVHRAMSKPDQHIVFLAQTRGAASARLYDVATKLTRAGVDGVKWYRGIGNEHIEFDNGSRIDVESPNIHGGHGASYSLIILDEAWSLEEHVLQGLLPTQTAIRDAQLWVVSTQGSEDAETWLRYVQLGRDSVKDRRSTVAYTEYAADLAAGDDVYDSSTWSGFMPALGCTVDIANIEPSLQAMSPGEALRAYGNVVTAVDSDLWPAEWIERSLDQYVNRPATGLVFGFDANFDPRGGSIYACWKRDDGRYHVELVERQATGDVLWMAKRMRDLIARHRPIAVVTPGGGPARAAADQIKAMCEQYVVPFVSLAVNDMAASHVLFSDALRTEAVTHDGSEALLEAMRRVRVRDAADQWRFDRKATRVDLSPLFAAAAGLKAAQDMDGRKREFAIF